MDDRCKSAAQNMPLSYRYDELAVTRPVDHSGSRIKVPKGPTGSAGRIAAGGKDKREIGRVKLPADPMPRRPSGGAQRGETAIRLPDRKRSTARMDEVKKLVAFMYETLAVHLPIAPLRRRQSDLVALVHMLRKDRIGKRIRNTSIEQGSSRIRRPRIASHQIHSGLRPIRAVLFRL